MEHLYNYNWKLSDGYPEWNGYKAFSCFACGGGSTMGYKKAGFKVLGCNEIDFKMISTYILNHNPKYAFHESISTFKNSEEIPDELYDLDILDGSPPCSSFSMSGNRSDDWGKEKKFREGQSDQILDTLFFDFIELGKRLQPKVIVAENVKGLIMGEAKDYVRKIYKSFKDAGYELRIHPYLLNASEMGVPQRRERVFFIAIRKDLADQFMEDIDMFQKAPKLNLHFNEQLINYGQIDEGLIDDFEKISPCDLKYYDECKPGDSISSVHPKGNRFNSIRLSKDKVCNTIAAGSDIFHYSQKRKLTKNELCLIGSYPLDYNFGKNKPIYMIGMSVPPVMTAQIANQIRIQWLDKLK